MRLLEVDAQLQILEHDRFQDALAPVVGPFFVSEHLVQGVEGPAGPSDFQKFWKITKQQYISRRGGFPAVAFVESATAAVATDATGRLLTIGAF